MSLAHPTLGIADPDNDAVLFLRFEMLSELADQLVQVDGRKRAKSEGWKTGYLARPLLRQSRSKGWGLTRCDVRWLISKVEERRYAVPGRG